MDTAGLNGWHVMRWFELLVEHYAGAELHDKLNTFEESWNCDAVVQAFEKYKEWVDAGYFPDGFLTLDPNDTIMAMGTGECAMDLQGQWYDGQFIQNDLDPNNYGVFAFPSGDDNRMSAFAEMTQFNANLSDEELDACVSSGITIRVMRMLQSMVSTITYRFLYRALKLRLSRST